MSTKKKTTGMFECKFIKDIAGAEKGEKVVYHASTAQTLADKGIVEIVKELKNYAPKTMKI